MSASDYRGKQITIGNLSMIFPKNGPITDEEIIETEHLVAQIAAAIDPHEKKVKFAKDVMKALQSDITRTMRDRIMEDEEPGLFNSGNDTHIGVDDVEGDDDEEENQYPECSGDPKSCPHNEGFGCCMQNDGSPWEDTEPAEADDDGAEEAEEGGEA